MIDLPRTRIPERDSWGVRAVAALLLVTAFAFSFGSLGGWMLLVTTVLSDTSALTDKSDIWLWLLQILGAIGFVGAIGIAGWNTWVSWRDGRHWMRKVWNTLILLATLVVFYFAWAGGLLAMTVNY